MLDPYAYVTPVRNAYLTDEELHELVKTSKWFGRNYPSVGEMSEAAKRHQERVPRVLAEVKDRKRAERAALIAELEDDETRTTK